MRIGEVSKITGLSEHTLRFYEKSGLLPMLAKRRGGVRDFCDNDLRALGIIECLKKTGMTLAEIRQYMEWNAQGDKTIKQRYDMFIQRRDAVMQQMNDMQKTLEMVNYKIKYYARAMRAGTMSIYDGKANKQPDFFAKPQNTKNTKRHWGISTGPSAE